MFGLFSFDNVGRSIKGLIQAYFAIVEVIILIICLIIGFRFDDGWIWVLLVLSFLFYSFINWVSCLVIYGYGEIVDNIIKIGERSDRRSEASFLDRLGVDNGSRWQCVCGRSNTMQTGTCVCGRKRNEQQEQERTWKCSCGRINSMQIEICSCGRTRGDINPSAGNRLKKCPKCGKVCKSSDEFCMKCGYQINPRSGGSRREEQPAVSRGTNCPKCGWAGTESDLFCMKCGTKLR